MKKEKYPSTYDPRYIQYYLTRGPGFRRDEYNVYVLMADGEQHWLGVFPIADRQVSVPDRDRADRMRHKNEERKEIDAEEDTIIYILRYMLGIAENNPKRQKVRVVKECHVPVSKERILYILNSLSGIKIDLSIINDICDDTNDDEYGNIIA